LHIFSDEFYGLAMSDSDESDSFYSDPRRIFAKLLPEEKRPVAYLTPNEAATAVEQARNQLFLIYDRLHRVVQLYESTIRKRWMKVRTPLSKANGLLTYNLDLQRPQAKRRALLLEISPKIPHHHAPEVQAFKQAESPGMLQTQRDEFLFPFVNLEDLCSEGGTKCKFNT
jgi:hypothetical protein